MTDSFIPVGTKTPMGIVQAVRSGNPRDYLLIGDDGGVAWLDELALNEIINGGSKK